MLMWTEKKKVSIGGSKNKMKKKEKYNLIWRILKDVRKNKYREIKTPFSYLNSTPSFK